MLHAFSSELRIRTKAQFQHVFRKRQRLFGNFCVIYCRKNSLNHPRLGVVVSKRNARKAVARNRFKRLAREVFRTQQNNLPAVDIVIVAKAGAGEKTKQELQTCLDQLLKQLNT